ASKEVMESSKFKGKAAGVSARELLTKLAQHQKETTQAFDEMTQGAGRDMSSMRDNLSFEQQRETQLKCGANEGKVENEERKRERTNKMTDFITTWCFRTSSQLQRNSLSLPECPG
ncbi:hypothetical protein HDV00_009624, partial [Rhizophlyctis rosea]